MWALDSCVLLGFDLHILNLEIHVQGICLKKVRQCSALFRLSSFILYLNVATTALTHISMASILWDIGKQYSSRCDAAERGVPSGAILFAQRNLIEK